MNKAIVLEEPEIILGKGQTAKHPRVGLSLYGPSMTPTLRTLRLGYVGPREGLEPAKRLIAALMDPLRFPVDVKARVAFPGFGALFGCDLPDRFELTKFIDLGELKQVLKIRERHQRIYSAVDLYLCPLEKARREEDSSSVLWICYVPDIVYTHCRPHSDALADVSITAAPSLTAKQLQQRLADITAGQGGLFDDAESDFNVEVVEYKTDFHHQLKHRLLASQIPVQLIREQTVAIVSQLGQTVAELRGMTRKYLPYIRM